MVRVPKIFDEYGITPFGILIIVGALMAIIITVIAIFMGDSNLETCGVTSKGDLIFCVKDSNNGGITNNG